MFLPVKYSIVYKKCQKIAVAVHWGMITFCATAQDNKSLDSLELVYKQSQYGSQEELKLLNQLAINQFDTEKKLKYSTLLIEKAEAQNASEYLLQGHIEKGNAFRLKSDYSDALGYYFKASKLATKYQLTKRIPIIDIAIADVYSLLEKRELALRYYIKSITLLRKEKDSTNLASALLNAGDLYATTNALDKALSFTKEAQSIFLQLDSKTGLAYSLGNLGMIYAKLKRDDIAQNYINKAIAILEQQHDYYPICVYLMIMSDIYLKKKDQEKAILYTIKSLELSKKYDLKKEIADSNFKLSLIFEKSKNYKQSLLHFKEYTIYSDSIQNIESVKRISEIQAKFEIDKKQLIVNKLNQEKKSQKIITIISLIGVVLLFLLAFGLYRRYKYVSKTNRIIEIEKNRSNALLLNILPEATAVELKEKGKVVSRKFESVTVLFTDFVGFTNYSETLEPEQLVQQIDYYFSKFDDIMEKYDLEKIKTIGDSYMCASGLTTDTQNHAYKMMAAAVEIIQFVEQCSIDPWPNQHWFQIRVGIHTGPVVAGVVGTRKFAYDIWGDTVNIASRMESNSIPGRINVSKDTYELLKNNYEFEYRGEIEVKNKGKMQMYFYNPNVIFNKV